MRTRLWYRLDNSAKIIPCTTTHLNTNVFRIACTLKEKVDPEVLSVALEESVEEFPLFLYTMKTGLFWHYLEKSNTKPKIELEHTNPCAKIDNGLLFRVSYYKNRINLEVYHALSDGNGAMEFLKFLVASYLNHKHGIEPEGTINSSSEYEKSLDAFSKFDKNKIKIKRSKVKKAYKFSFKRKEDTILDIVEAHMSIKELKSLAQKYDATVTVYLSAILTKSIIECARIKDLNRPIGITIPVDLRTIFPSKTSRNFFYTISVSYKYKEGDTLKDIIESLKKEFAKNLTKENIEALLNTYMLLEKFLIIRIIPAVLKDLILSPIMHFSKTGETMTLSNVGVVKMPKEYEPYIDSISGYMNSNSIHLTTMTFKDDLALSFTSHFTTKELERTMLRLLKEEGIKNIKVISNVKE